MLAVRELCAGYGASQVLFGVNLEVGAGECVALLGRNGMGKTTTVRAIMGLIGVQAGSIAFEGASLAGASPEHVARAGIGLVPEGRHVFPTLTIYENLVATASNRTARAQPWTHEQIFELFPLLRARASNYARTLSGGEQQMLAIGRALMTNPKLLILDEATEGLAPLVRVEIWKTLAELKARGHAILVIDKELHALLDLADRHYFIERGRTVWNGTSRQLRADPATVQRYLGV